jgi:pimeloyl-ACP methyl ester carboxylesterase
MGWEVVAMKNLTVKSGTAQLAVSRDGIGQALVFLHAAVADKRSWQPLISALSEATDSFYGVSYDRRGFGDSTFTEEPHSRVGDLVAVLDACDLASVVLIGNSQGGRIAIDTALLHAKRVRALVLIGTAVSGAPEVDSYPTDVTELKRKIEAAEATGDLDLLNRLEAHLWLDGPSSTEGRIGGAARELFLDMNLRALHALSVGEVTDNVDAWNNLPKIQVPVLLMVGQLDLPHLQERSARMAEIIPHAELVLMKDVAHLPALEAPQQSAAIIAKFFARHNIV